MSNRPPVHIRRNVESTDDTYIDQESLEEITICRECASVYTGGRWKLSEQVTDKSMLRGAHRDVLCPACQKMRDKVPHGILKLSGHFVQSHEEEIMNLIRNEAKKAQAVNPLERIMSLESAHECIEITTTNEKLAQRIGRALHKAYDGDVDYKWSDAKIARVNWHREM